MEFKVCLFLLKALATYFLFLLCNQFFNHIQLKIPSNDAILHWERVGLTSTKGCDSWSTNQKVYPINNDATFLREYTIAASSISWVA